MSFFTGQKRRSNRVVKRKKYTEDLDIKITDDEDEQEDVDVTTTAAAVASISGGTAAQLKQELELDGDGQPSMQFFVVSDRLCTVDRIKCFYSVGIMFSPVILF